MLLKFSGNGDVSTEQKHQRDGAPPHYHPDVHAYLDDNLPGHWIGGGGPIEFPPRSPDLTPLDFCLWGDS